MTKLTLPRIDPLKGSASQINAAFDSIEQWSDNVMSRDAQAPNQKLDVLDMNSNKIINGEWAESGSDYPTWEQVLGLLGDGGSGPAPIVGEANVGQNIGVGIGWYAGKSGVALQFKSIQAGNNVSIAEANGTVTVSSTATGGGEADVSEITVYSVKTFGAVGDKTTDDTAAIEATLAAAQAATQSGGSIGTVYFPPGVYQWNPTKLLSGRVQMFAHPNSATICGNIVIQDTYPKSADVVPPVDINTPNVNLFGLKFDAAVGQTDTDQTPCLTINHVEVQGWYVLVGSIGHCEFYGNVGLEANSVITLNVDQCKFYSRNIGYCANTVTNCGISGSMFHNQNDTAILVGVSQFRDPLKRLWPGGEHIKITGCDIAAASTGIRAYKSSWMVVTDTMVDNCGNPMYLEGCYEYSFSQTYFGASMAPLSTYKDQPGFRDVSTYKMGQDDPTPTLEAPARMPVCIQGDMTDNGEQALNTGSHFQSCRFVNYTNWVESDGTTPQTVTLPLVGCWGDSYGPNRGNGLFFSDCLFMISEAHAITPALLHIREYDEVHLHNNRFHSYILTPQGANFVPYKWEVVFEGTGIGFMNEFNSCRDSTDTVITAPQESYLGEDTPDLSAYYTKVEADARFAPKPFVIAVIGDSYTTFPELNMCFPGWVGQHINDCGLTTQVHTFGALGFTYADAQTGGVAMFNGRVATRAAIDIKPDLIIVSLGINDVINGIQNTATSDAFYQELASFASGDGISPTILYASQEIWDSFKFGTSPTACKSFGTVGWFHALENNNGDLVDPLDTPAADTANFTDKNFAGLLTSGAQTQLNDFVAFDSHIRSTIMTNTGQAGNNDDYWLSLNIFRAHRLGLGSDLLHCSVPGQEFLAGYVIQKLMTPAMQAAMPKLAVLFDTLAPSFRPDDLFLSMFTGVQNDTDNDWDTQYERNGNLFIYWADQRQHDWSRGLESWYRKNKLTWTIDGTNLNIDTGLGQDTFMMFGKHMPAGGAVFGKLWKPGETEPAWTNMGIDNTVYPTSETMIYNVTGSQLETIFGITPAVDYSSYTMSVKVTSDWFPETAGDVWNLGFSIQIKKTPFDNAEVPTTFLELDDVTETDYAGRDGELVAVNRTGDGLEFIPNAVDDMSITDLIDVPSFLGNVGQVLKVQTPSTLVWANDDVGAGAENFTELNDVPSNGFTGRQFQHVRVNSSESALEYVDPATTITASKIWMHSGQSETNYDYTGSTNTSLTLGTWQDAFSFTLNPSQGIQSGDSLQFNIGLSYAIMCASVHLNSSLAQIMEGGGLDIQILENNSPIADWEDWASELPYVSGGDNKEATAILTTASTGTVTHSPAGDVQPTIAGPEFREGWLTRFTSWARANTGSIVFNRVVPSSGSKTYKLQFRLTALRVTPTVFAYSNIRSKRVDINPNGNKTTWTVMQVRDSY